MTEYPFNLPEPLLFMRDEIIIRYNDTPVWQIFKRRRIDRELTAFDKIQREMQSLVESVMDRR